MTRLTGLQGLIVGGLLIIIAQGAGATDAGNPTRQLPATSAALPLSFEANRGQADQSVSFMARGTGYGLFLTQQEAVLALRKPGCWVLPRPVDARTQARARRAGPARISSVEDCSNNTTTVRMQLQGAASRRPAAQGEQPLDGTVNYFIGNDPTQWHTNAPTYGKVRYAAVYPGVDLVYYGNQRQLEYDFVVAPHADPAAIRLRFAGADTLKLDATGNLTVSVRHGAVTLHKPLLYQTINGRRQSVDGSFDVAGNYTVAFRVGKYDRKVPLIIDPVLVYSTYLGGGGTATLDPTTSLALPMDSLQAIAADAQGNTYVAGITFSASFPVTSGALRGAQPAPTPFFDSFVTKLNPTGTAIVYSTYLGGTNFTNQGTYYNYLLFGDSANALAVDSVGNVYVAGTAQSSDFPVTAGAFQTHSNIPTSPCPLATTGGTVSNGFVAKLNPTGSALLYSTYLGGTGYWYASGSVSSGPITSANTCTGSGDNIVSLALDAAGDLFIAGSSASTDFPVTSGAYQTTAPGQAGDTSAFVTKLNPTGTALLYSTYLGGSQVTQGEQTALLSSIAGLAADAAGDAYVTGLTSTTDFPVTAGAYLTTYGVGFVTKLNPTGSALVYSTDFAGLPTAIAVDSAGSAYITGSGGDFTATPGAFQPTSKGTVFYTPAFDPQQTVSTVNAFVVKMNATGTGLSYATYLGGSGDFIDARYCSNFEGSSPSCNNSAGTASTPSGDSGYAIAVDTSGNAYVTGKTESSNFPVTAGALQPVANGAGCTATMNAFVTEVNATGTGLVYSTYLGGSGQIGQADGDGAQALALDATNNVYIGGIAYSTDFPVSATAAIGHNPSGYSAFVAKLNLTATSLTPLITLTPANSTVTTAQQFMVTATVAANGGGAAPTGTLVLQGNNNQVQLFAQYLATNSSTTLIPPATNPYATSATLVNGSATFTIQPGTFPAGPFCLNASYIPDTASYTTYNNAAGTTGLTVVSGTGTQITIGTSPGGPTFTVDGVAYTGVQTLVWVPGTTHTIATLSPQMVGAGQYTFGSWSDAGGLSHTVTAPTTATTYTANFTAKWALTTTPSPSTEGTVTPAGTGYYPAGTIVPVTAKAASGFAFTNWTGSVASATSATTTATVPSGGLSISANFAAAATPSVSVTPGALTFTSVPGTPSAAQQITVKNTSTATLDFTAMAINGANAGNFTSTSSCAGSLSPGATCTVSINFEATAIATYSATLTISDDALSAPQLVTLSGTGVAGPSGTTATPTFTVTSTTTPQSIIPGGSASYSIAVTPMNGDFTGAVMLSATGIPTGATATFSPTTVTPGAAAVTVTLTIDTVKTLADNLQQPLTLPALSLFGLIWVPRRRSRLVTLGMFVGLSVAAMGLLSACSNGGFSSPASDVHTYEVTITGTSGSTQQSTTVQLTVQ